MNIENILKIAYEKYKENEKSKPVGKCLSDEDITSFLDDVSSEDEKKGFINHIVSCYECAKSLKYHYAVMREIDEKGQMEVPSSLVEQAKGLVVEEARDNVLDIMLEFKEKVIHLINTTGEIIEGALGPDLVPAHAFRAAKKDEKANEIKVNKDFTDLCVAVEVEKQKPEFANIVVRLSDKATKTRAAGIRVSLIKDDRELESSYAEEGKIKFESIKPGNYKISMIKDGKQIGVINIVMKVSL